MDAERFDRLADLFEEGRALTPEARDDWLDARCEGDADLRRELVELFAAHERDARDLEPPDEVGRLRPVVDSALRSNPTSGDDEWLRPGATIGEFTLLRELGSGGQGVVWEAEQEHPKRRVALKLLRPELGVSATRQRFEREAQALARVSHPGIASIHATGAEETAFGLVPWFAMELVDGRPIVAHAEAEQLDTASRIELVAEVCDAIAAAHAHGVLHRDLKPDNVFVDGHGRARVLDFGVARFTDADVRAGTLRTDTGQVIGTLAYMSPEQASGDPGSIDERTDVFSLGVILFELLTGRLPRELDHLPLPAQLWEITRGETTRLSNVEHSLRGDLETIVAKALAPEADQRYRGARDLAADLRRYLASEPIRARPASRSYRISRFVRRNRALTVLGAAAFTILVVGAVTSTVMYFAARENARAEAERSDEVFRLSSIETLRDLRRRADELWPVHTALIGDYREWLADAREVLDAEPLHRATLEGLGVESTGRADLAERESAWWTTQLTRLLDEIGSMRDPSHGLASAEGASTAHGWSVPRRLERAERWRDERGPGSEWRERWTRALPGIRASYPKVELEPQVDLWPIGPDPASGLHEFWHEPSGAEPHRDENGRLQVTADTGIVLVLIRGGTLSMGCQVHDPDGANFDVDANGMASPVHAVELSPYFVSKYEVSQGQWIRGAGSNPSHFGPEGLNWPESNRFGEPMDHRLPVENVSWNESLEWCRRFGLTLPTEAQWELAARAGTTTPWWTGEDARSVEGAANIADRFGAAGTELAHEVWLDDGYGPTCGVATLNANGFGLHHVLGNVFEWCLDGGWVSFYAESPRRDPCAAHDIEQRAYRGGSFAGPASSARSAVRHFADRTYTTRFLGFRPARPLSL